MNKKDKIKKLKKQNKSLHRDIEHLTSVYINALTDLYEEEYRASESEDFAGVWHDQHHALVNDLSAALTQLSIDLNYILARLDIEADIHDTPEDDYL